MGLQSHSCSLDNKSISANAICALTKNLLSFKLFIHWNNQQNGKCIIAHLQNILYPVIKTLWVKLCSVSSISFRRYWKWGTLHLSLTLTWGAARFTFCLYNFIGAFTQSECRCLTNITHSHAFFSCTSSSVIQ